MSAGNISSVSSCYSPEAIDKIRFENNGRIINRLLAKIKFDEPDDCWPWRGAVNPKGYGRFKVFGRLTSPHILVYILAKGPLPPRVKYNRPIVRRSCGNSGCCNPAHLVAGMETRDAATAAVDAEERATL